MKFISIILHIAVLGRGLCTEEQHGHFQGDAQQSLVDAIPRSEVRDKESRCLHTTHELIRRKNSFDQPASTPRVDSELDAKDSSKTSTKKRRALQKSSKSGHLSKGSKTSTTTSTTSSHDIKNAAPFAKCHPVIEIEATASNCLISLDDDELIKLIDNKSYDPDEALGQKITLHIVKNPGQMSPGSHQVILTVTDDFSHPASATCQSNIIVKDKIVPIAKCRDATVQLDILGIATMGPPDIDGGSSDNCYAFESEASQTEFTCEDIGPNFVTLNVTDENGNSAQCTSTVTVEDNLPPIALCKNTTVQLDSSSKTYITVTDIDDGSNDACGSLSLSVSQSDFGFNNVGPNQVTLNVTDVNGNFAYCTSMVTITPPPPFSVLPGQVIKDKDEILTFQVIPEEIPNGSPVNLYLVESGEFIGVALDDGSSSAGDIQAGDGVFTNTFSFNFQDTGDVQFKATIRSVEYYSRIIVLDGSTVVNSSVAEALEKKFLDLAVGQSYLDAFQKVYDDFLANLPGNVQANVVLTLGNYPSLAWTTSEGLTEVIASGLPFQRGPPNWEPILFGDNIAMVTALPARHSDLLVDHIPVHHNLRNDDAGCHNCSKPPRRTEDDRFLECLKGILGIEVSFHGMQSDNFLWDYAKSKGFPTRISYHTSSPMGADPLSILKGLQAYQLISIVAPTRVIRYGDGQTTIALITDVPLTSSSQYAGDMAAMRIIAVNGYLGVTPEFFKKYTSNGAGGSVYIGGSESNKFLSAFSGFNVLFSHASSWSPVDPWISLFSKDEARVTPCVVHDACTIHAVDPTWSLIDLCEDRLLPKLVVTYTWPLSQRDLDTNTQFLGHSVGWGCGSEAPYMAWSGDDTSAGGKETVIIDLNSALENNAWSENDGVLINLSAGWFMSAGGSGPATVSVQFEDGTSNSGIQTISPGRQGGCSYTCVGSVFVSVLPRLQAQFTEGKCGFIPDSPQGPTEKPCVLPTCQSISDQQSYVAFFGSDDLQANAVALTQQMVCEQKEYDTVKFNPYGPGEWSVAFRHGTVRDLYKLDQFKNDAFITSQLVYRLPTCACQFNDCDAFRHSYFNYQLTTWRNGLWFWSDDEAVAWAKMWADAHEISSPNCFSVRMQDLRNNDVGRRLAIEKPRTDKAGAIAVLKQAIQDGQMATTPVNTCGVSSGNNICEVPYELCIFSNVAKGVGDPGLITNTGHAFLLLTDKQVSPPNRKTYGLWPDNIAPDNGDESDIREGYEEDKPDNYPYALCLSITNVQKNKFDAIVEAGQSWTCTNTCASFASETFKEVTGIDVDADDDILGFETPRTIGSSIRELMGGKDRNFDARRSLHAIQPPMPRAVIIPSLVTSFTAAWFLLCYP